ncbi:MAG: hypothetical protein M3136_09015 [Thermoproteota archaeon]|nr:hypothetical protein [Thermoproteota archaeon]
MNHRTLLKIGFIVSAFSLFSGLVTITSPSSFPWKSALAQIDGNETSDAIQTPEDQTPPGDLGDTSTGEEPEPPTNGNQTNGNGAEPPPPTNGNQTNGNGAEPPPPTNGNQTNGNQTNGNQTNGNVTTPRDQLEVRIGDLILQPECAAEHWNKIVFRITTDPTGKVPSSMINTELEAIERVNHIGVLNVNDIVRGSIVNEPGVLLPQLTYEEASQLGIEIIDVEYGLACLP